MKIAFHICPRAVSAAKVTGFGNSVNSWHNDKKAASFTVRPMLFVLTFYRFFNTLFKGLV
ncbi:hypothetical protein AR688_00905 [Rheinheimera sp. EpRS3]|nr:hypothetical protein AR688_00905 [Rheinheimera sp. EpRS3]